jgi:hypothetical protein
MGRLPVLDGWVSEVDGGEESEERRTTSSIIRLLV